MSEIKKVVLAYSGGLDTSIIIPWLKENYNDPEIIAVSGDVGQGAELDGLEEKAIKTGASKLYVEDLTDQMVDEVIIPSMMMGAKYGRIFGLHSHNLYLRVIGFQGCTHTTHCASRTYTGHENIHPAVCITPDFLSGSTLVHCRIGRVVKLL